LSQGDNTPKQKHRTSGGRRRRRLPGERAGLDAEAILSEARLILERDGIENLTMRRLAESLGVAPNALYSHFADKSALLDALMDALLVEVEVEADDQGEWREGLVALLQSTRRFLLSHADVLPHYMSGPTRGPNAIRLGEETLGLLSRAGLRGATAADALRILLTYTFGFAAQEAPRLADPDPDLSRMRSENAFRAARDQPLMRDLAGELSEYPGDDTFVKGLSWLLDGIHAMTRGDEVQKESRPPADGSPPQWT
jgi:TetR/AcrR family tetracycline transcriptional repressor